MDVRLPDGTIIKGVPDGMSKADLTAKLAANGYDVAKLAPAPAAAPLAPPPKAPARPARAKGPANLFAAGSGAMVGPALKTYVDTPVGKACKCAAGAAVPHWHFKCPLALAALFGHPCPGFDAAGALLPGDWSGADLSAAARTNWRTLVARHGLAGPRMSNGRVPNF